MTRRLYSELREIKNSKYPMYAIDNLREILSIESDSSGGHIVELNQKLGVGGV